MQAVTPIVWSYNEKQTHEKPTQTEPLFIAGSETLHKVKMNAGPELHIERFQRVITSTLYLPVSASY